MLKNSVTIYVHITNEEKVGPQSTTQAAKELTSRFKYEYSSKLIDVTVDNHSERIRTQR